MASLINSLSSVAASSKHREAAEIEFSRETASIVKSVILMGCPASVNKFTWTTV